MQKQLFYRRWRLTKREWCFCGEGGVSCVSVSSMTTIAAEGNWAVFFFCWVISACIIGAIEKTTEVNTWILSTCSPLVTSCGEVTRVSKDVGYAPSEQNVLSSIVVLFAATQLCTLCELHWIQLLEYSKPSRSSSSLSWERKELPEIFWCKNDKFLVPFWFFWKNRHKLWWNNFFCRYLWNKYLAAKQPDFGSVLVALML